MVQYQISMTRTLTECKGPQLAKIGSDPTWAEISVEMTYETDIEESFVADPGETYTVDYEAFHPGQRRTRSN
ncbi:MAG: hypothetical protein U5L06_12595 [Rhodovibrio sp.]|nr:hypothetical protein [Rhodovibrio sp.]